MEHGSPLLDEAQRALGAPTVGNHPAEELIFFQDQCWKPLCSKRGPEIGSGAATAEIRKRKPRRSHPALGAASAGASLDLYFECISSFYYTWCQF